jgi:hypothetical protein
MRAVIFLFLLAGCSTPKTMLVNDDTGETHVCGDQVSGSLLGGLAGYYIQSQSAAKCVQDFSQQGF